MQFSAKDVWILMTDVNLALEIVQEAAKYYKQSLGSDRLIDRGGAKVEKEHHGRSRNKNRARACPAAFVCPVNKESLEYPTVFEMVSLDDERSPMDVQWAIMTLIAIHSQFREDVAAASPGPAAKLVREMPARFERYLMGTETTETTTPYEAVCDFASRVQLAYAGIEQTRK